MAKKFKLPAFPKAAFRSHIRQAINQWQQLVACRNKAKAKNKAPSSRCLKNRTNARKHLSKAVAIYHGHRRAQRKKGKWTKREDRYFAGEIARVSALVYPKAHTSLTTGTKTVTTAAASRTTVPAGTTAVASRIGTPILATAALPSVVDDVISELPSDPFSGEAEVAAYEFEPAGDEDLELGLLLDEEMVLGEDEEPEGIIEKMQNRPIMSVAAVAIVGGVVYTIWQRMK
jgi:hypothetical protein